MSRLYDANNCWLPSGIDSTDTWRLQPSVFWREITVHQYSTSTYLSRRQTPDVALTGLPSGVCFLTGDLKSVLISPKVWYSLEVRKFICIHLHHIMFSKPIKMTALRLKFAALIQRFKSVENGCMMWKTLPINLFWWGSQLLGTTWPTATRVFHRARQRTLATRLF